MLSVLFSGLACSHGLICNNTAHLLPLCQMYNLQGHVLILVVLVLSTVTAAFFNFKK